LIDEQEGGMMFLRMHALKISSHNVTFDDGDFLQTLAMVFQKKTTK